MRYKDSITLHPKYGLNPTMSQCFFCGKSKDVLLFGLPSRKVVDAGLTRRDGEMRPSIGQYRRGR